MLKNACKKREKQLYDIGIVRCSPQPSEYGIYACQPTLAVHGHDQSSKKNICHL